MTKNFDSLIAFSEHLFRAATVELKAFKDGLTIASQLIQNNAKDQIGVLQPEDGPFPAWEELSDLTISSKIRRGVVFNDDYNPLYVTGDLQNSITYEVLDNALEAIVGSTDPIGAFQEFGTSRIPARSFIGRAAFREAENIANFFGAIAIRGFAGGNMIVEDIGRAYGYHMDLKR